MERNVRDEGWSSLRSRRGSLFWLIVSCAVSLGLHLQWEFCIPIDETRNDQPEKKGECLGLIEWKGPAFFSLKSIPLALGSKCSLGMMHTTDVVRLQGKA